jgi:hypothetical protein
MIAFPPHLTHVLQLVDVVWARTFKTEFVEFFRMWASPDPKPF